MRLPQFSFYQPTTVDEAGEVLQEKAGARLLSGGTDLLVNMKHRVELPHALVSLRRIAGLIGITRDGGATVIGALTTLKEVQNSTELQAEYPALVEAARSVGSYRQQTMGALGGNVCQNTPLPFPQSLLALAAGGSSDTHFLPATPWSDVGKSPLSVPPPPAPDTPPEAQCCSELLSRWSVRR